MTENLNNYRRAYVIGDIHGRRDLLDRMVSEIERDVADQNIAECVTVTLGDYVDRGPHSRGVLDRLSGNPFPTRYIALRGNHEELFETFLTDPKIGPGWREVGGLETLHSYGVPVRDLMLGKNYEQASTALIAALPSSHREFLSSLQLSAEFGQFFLCHAGIRPGVRFEEQRTEDLLWIRNEFLNSAMDFGKRVIHGHTPVEQPEVLPNRINIDTGAFITGRLTCVVLEADSHRFLFA